MILSNWEDGSYGFYLLASGKTIDDNFRHWAVALKADTLRVLCDSQGIAIGSGHGNTHDSMLRKLRTIAVYKRWFPRDYIVHLKDGKPVFYCSADGDSDKRWSIPERIPEYWHRWN